MAEQRGDEPTGTDRAYICWNCGSLEHRLSDCDKEVRQENKTFWRKYFRRFDKKEKARHQRRYARFLKARPSVKQDHDEDDGGNEEAAGTANVVGPGRGNPKFWEKHRQFVEEQRMKTSSRNHMDDNVIAQFQTETNGNAHQPEPGNRNMGSRAESSVRGSNPAESDSEGSSSSFETDSE